MTVFVRRLVHALVVVAVDVAVIGSFVGAFVLSTPANLASAAACALLVGCVAYAVAGTEA